MIREVVRTTNGANEVVIRSGIDEKIERALAEAREDFPTETFEVRVWDRPDQSHLPTAADVAEQYRKDERNEIRRGIYAKRAKKESAR